jgi:hypothetical protein
MTFFTGERKYMLQKGIASPLQRPHRAQRTLRATLLIAGWGIATGALMAQDAMPAPVRKGGMQIRSVSAYTAYYSNGLGETGALQPGAGNLLSDVGFGGSALLEWTKFSERSTFSLNYTPSYTGRVRYSSLNALNHAFSVNASRKLAPRWTFGLHIAGDYSSLEQSLFTPTTLGNVASVQASFDDLAAAMLSSKFSNNPQLGFALTSAPLVESPVRNLLYGQRMFTTSGQASLSYSYSPRLTITLNGGASRSQHVSESGASSTQNSFLIPNTTSGNASFAISYSLSPNTQLGGTVTATRTSSSLADLYTTASTTSLGRTLGRRWLFQVHGGVGVTTPVRQTNFKLSTTPRPMAGASLAFKTFSHTVLGSFDRAVNDSYGLGAATSNTGQFTWRWGRPGSGWWFESSIAAQQLQGGASLADTSGWQGSTGLGRAVGKHLVLHTQYAYMHYSGGLQRSANHLSQSAIRVSMVWTPDQNTLR